MYNTKPQYIIEAIESVIANNYPKIQHIIIDDFSTIVQHKESVKAWIKQQNYKCEFYEHEKNYGISKTMNHVLRLARGKYLIPACDDVLHPNRIMHDIILMEQMGEEYAFIAGKSEFINENSEKTGNSSKVYKKEEIKGDYFKHLVQAGNWISAPAVTLRKEIVDKLGGFDERFLFEDYPMWLKILDFKKKLIVHDKTLTYKRIHTSSISYKINYKIHDIFILYDYIENTIVKAKVADNLRELLSLNFKNNLIELIHTMGLKKTTKVIYCLITSKRWPK